MNRKARYGAVSPSFIYIEVCGIVRSGRLIRYAIMTRVFFDRGGLADCVVAIDKPERGHI